MQKYWARFYGRYIEFRFARRQNDDESRRRPMWTGVGSKGGKPLVVYWCSRTDV